MQPLILDGSLLVESNFSGFQVPVGLSVDAGIRVEDPRDLFPSIP